MNKTEELLDLLLTAPKSQIGITTYTRLQQVKESAEEKRAEMLEEVIKDSELFNQDSEFAVMTMKILLKLAKDDK
jgi:hypothetical protein